MAARLNGKQVAALERAWRAEKKPDDVRGFALSTIRRYFERFEVGKFGVIPNTGVLRSGRRHAVARVVYLGPAMIGKGIPCVMPIDGWIGQRFSERHA